MLISIEEIKEKRGGVFKKGVSFFLYFDFFLSLIAGAKAPVKTPKSLLGVFGNMGLFDYENWYFLN